jgi:hypothetical protein
MEDRTGSSPETPIGRGIRARALPTTGLPSAGLNCAGASEKGDYLG